MDKNEMIVIALQQRIGELTAQYELDKAIIRAEYTEISEDLKNKEEIIKNYSTSMQAKCEEEEKYKKIIEDLEFKNLSLVSLLEQNEIEVDKKSIKKAIK